MRYLILFLLLSCIPASFIFAQQNLYGLQQPSQKANVKCARCFQTLSRKPKEVQIGVFIDEQDDIKFYISKPELFGALFKNKDDGIAIDLISKDQYACGAKTKVRKDVPRGTLLPPVYLKELKKNSEVTDNGVLIIQLGPVPAKLKGKEIEANYIIVQDNNICHYQITYNLVAYGWDLLDMGMYMDSIVYHHQKTAKDTLSEETTNLKSLKFTIPFEKNKYEYSKADIKPLYDSLNLTDFTIKNITIKAYSSIDGNEKKNIELQEKRAKSIADALQSYQQPHITTTLFASENWVEFYNDIEGTKFVQLSPLSKEEVKAQLTNKATVEALEPILKKHRKAVITVELERKRTLTEVSSGALPGLFDEAVAKNNVVRAKEIQNTVFSRISNHEIAPNLTEQLKVPRQIAYSQLLINRSAFNYFRDPDTYAAYLEFQELETLLPNDKKIKYNICVLMFRLMMEGEHVIQPAELKNSIDKLSSYKIPTPLIDRMLINYNILMCESYMSKGDYPNKDKALKYIQTNYKKAPITDEGRVSLAQFLSAYARYDWATKVLETEINKIDASEDLLFYYLNLTIWDSKMNSKPNYKVVMSNALNANKARYCQMFNAIKNKGVSFQLLESDAIKKNYCESCHFTYK